MVIDVAWNEKHRKGYEVVWVWNLLTTATSTTTNAYHGKFKFGTNFQKWMQKFFKIPTSMIFQNYIKCVLTSMRTNKHEAVGSFIGTDWKRGN